MQLKQRILAKLEKDDMSVLKMSKETGISASRIYKWLDDKGNPKTEDAKKLELWLNGNLEVPPKTGNNNAKEGIDANPYLKLLEDNDRFFKTEYHNLMVSLKELIAQGQRAERLLKLNLQHIGTVEALQKGIAEDAVQEQIGNQIAGIPEGEGKDSDGDT